MINLKMIKSMTLGIAVADAVGVPVEFKNRETLKRKPVTDMFGFGVIINQQEHGQMIQA